MSTKKILIVDDEPCITEVIEMYAKRLGYPSDTARSGDEAIALSRQNEYWAVFCDYLMPGASGLDVFLSLDAMRPDRTARFVLLTGTVLDDHLQQRAQHQNITVLNKPFNFDGIKRVFASLEGLPVVK